MTLRLKVQNLGKIKDAEFHLNPMTVITGPNGTGKSFFTKSLYSIFRVIEESSALGFGRGDGYNTTVSDDLNDELKENFQISNIQELIRYDQENASIRIGDFFEFILTGNAAEFVTDNNHDFIQFFRQKPGSVFFESPAYWRVRDALTDAKMKSGDAYLSGVPKYFFDLDSALRKQSKKPTELLEIYQLIRDELNGEFILNHGELAFRDDDIHTAVSKNLISFGMTNLGMLNALIKNNVIQKGSYVFIDEPETNLHPDWQVLMIKSLVALSEAGVNVVINTHSTEILKFIEVYFSRMEKEQGEEKVKQLLSVNYLDTDGTTLTFDSDSPTEQAGEALSLLSASYFALYMGDL